MARLSWTGKGQRKDICRITAADMLHGKVHTSESFTSVHTSIAEMGNGGVSRPTMFHSFTNLPPRTATLEVEGDKRGPGVNATYCIMNNSASVSVFRFKFLAINHVFLFHSIKL